MAEENPQSLMGDNLSNRLYEFRAPKYKFWKKQGLAYFAGEDMEYLTNELLCVSEIEVRKYSEACVDLYAMYERAAQHVIDHGLWEDLGIPDNCIPMITHTWNERNIHPHLYGRFDLAGIIDGRAAKLIEFNADTATVMPETAIIQYEQLRAARIKGSHQYSQLHERLARSFDEVKKANPAKKAKILLSDLGHEEDRLNLDVVRKAAKLAGFENHLSRLDQVTFSPDEGIFLQLGGGEFVRYDYWFKLVPWEFIAYEEPELMDILTQIVTKGLATILNPAYTMIYQSKAIMKVLWDLYPNHPLLLKTTFSKDDFKYEAYVQKVIFGREGQNIKVFDSGAALLEETGGDCEDFPSIYQSFVELPCDRDEEIYQAGVYFTDKACSLSFRRRDGLVVDEDAEFIGHYVL